MLTLPDAIASLLIPFATLFTSPTWRKVQVLLVGAIPTPGQRTRRLPPTPSPPRTAPSPACSLSRSPKSFGKSSG